jgi:hypothetical protein
MQVVDRCAVEKRYRDYGWSESDGVDRGRKREWRVIIEVGVDEVSETIECAKKLLQWMDYGREAVSLIRFENLSARFPRRLP